MCAVEAGAGLCTWSPARRERFHSRFCSAASIGVDIFEGVAGTSRRKKKVKVLPNRIKLSTYISLGKY